MPKFYNRVHLLKNTDSYWTEKNPLLLDGEVILVSFENGDVRIKVGDGKLRYSELNFITSSGTGGASEEDFEELKALIDSALDTVYVEIDDLKEHQNEYSATVENLKAAIELNKQNIEALKTFDEETKTAIDNLQNADSAIQSSIESNRDSIRDNISSIETLQDEVNFLKELVNAPSEDKELRDKVDELKAKVEENTTSINAYDGQIKALTAEVDANNSRVGLMGKEVQRIDNEVKDNTSYVSSVKEDLLDINTNIDIHDEAIFGLQEKVTALEPRVDSHDSSIQAIEENISDIESKVDLIQTDIEGLESGIASNSSKIELLKDRVNNLIDGSTGGSGDGEVNVNIAEVVDIRNGYDGTIYPTAGDAVRALGEKISEIEKQPINPDDLGLVRDETTGLVHPTYKGVRSVNGIPLSSTGGGGGTTASLFRLRSTTESLSFSASYGDAVQISYTFSSLDPYDGSQTGNGTAFYYVNSNLVYTAAIPQEEIFFECSKYLVEGNNEVTVTVKNADGDEKSLTWTVNCISIRLTSTFDYTQAYGESVTFKYTAYGDAEKKIHFILDGVEDEEIPVITSTGRQNTKVFSGLTHGLHTLEVYAVAVINDVDIKSNILKYDIIVNIEPAVEPIISINCDTTELLQGELLSIPYIVYDPLATESNANLEIWQLVEGEWTLYKSETRTVDRSLQYWNTRYYPLGDVRFTIRLREVSRTLTIHVDEYDLPIEPTTNDLELLLTSANRSNSELNPAIWEYNDIKTEFHNVNWASSGWLADVNGDTCLHLTGGSTATIKFKPFASDLRVFGKTLEFEFAVRDVNNRDANVISCKNGNIGVEITADTATLSSNLASVNCRFNDERKLRISFTIENRSENRMMSVYVDGVLTSCKQYVTTDNFQQTEPVEITIGSPYCSVDLYTVRSYTTALSQNDIINNYICDIADVTTKAEIYDRNNLYDTSMNLDYSKVKKQIPVMTITGALPQSKGDKKDVTVSYEDFRDSEMNFTDLPCNIDVQGTSSQWYVRKNYKLKFKQEITHIKGQIPNKVWCVKADYAEATSTHNTQIANIVHTLYSDLTPAQEVDSRCRTTISGFPIVIYHKETIDSIPQFLGKYNFNYDKGSEEAFGFTEDFDVESWEFCNNTSVACNFTGNIPADYKMTDENNNEVGWVNDFERRYPDHDGIDEGDEIPNEAIARFRTMHDWVVSTINYDLNNPEILEQYRTEFQEIFNLHKVLVYYVWTFFFLMVDQRAKNMFMTYWGATGKWEPWLYDNDTCLGINNEGQMVFDYYHEDTDLMPDGSKVYNGQDSTLWNKFRVAFAPEIQKTYQELRSSNKLSYETIRNQFVNEGSSKWSETIYNEDSDYKYISMLRESGDATNLPQIKGTGEHHLEYFLDGRINYCDSKWYATGYNEATDPGYVNDFIVLRVNTPETTSTIQPNANITITPFSNMYAGVRYRANGTLQQKRLAKNETYTFIAPADNFNDTETAIYGASQISSLGDLSPLYCNYIDVSSASKLIELKIGTDDTSYESNLKHLSLGTNRLLKKLDIRNCKNLTEPVDLSGCTGIEEVYAEGSSISSMELADSGYLRIVHLPGSITTLTIKNQKYIEEFTMESYENIKELHVDNSPNLPLTDILLNTPLLERVRLINAEWETTEEGLAQTYQKLLLCGGIDETGANSAKAVVSGIVKVPSIDNELLGKINEDFPELMVSVNGTILCTVSYFNYDGSLLYVTTVERGTNAPDIVADGTIETPVKPTTDTHKYEYRGWSDSLENIERSKAFVAMYDVFYAVRFLRDEELLYLEYVLEGSAVEDPIEAGHIETPTKESTAQYHFTFDHWDTDFSNIKDVTYVNAVFKETLRSYDISFFNEDILLEKKVVDYGAEITYTGTKPSKLYVEFPQDYTFLGWSPELGTCKGEAVFLAVFSDSDHILDDWATISKNVANGTYKEKYPIGVLQRTMLTYDDGTQEEVDMELVGYDHDITPDGQTAGMTFIMKNILKDKYRMGSSAILNRGGWAESDMRKYLNETVMPMLPDELVEVLVPVVKKTSSGGGNVDVENIVETTDTIWLPALVEFDEDYTDPSKHAVYIAEGTTYERMKNEADINATKAKRIKYDSNGMAQRYWLRTPVAMTSNEYWMIIKGGGSSNLYAAYTDHGVVFGFCVGIKPTE